MFIHACSQILVLEHWENPIFEKLLITGARVVRQTVKFSTQATLPDLLTIVIIRISG